MQCSFRLGTQNGTKEKKKKQIHLYINNITYIYTYIKEWRTKRRSGRRRRKNRGSPSVVEAAAGIAAMRWLNNWVSGPRQSLTLMAALFFSMTNDANLDTRNQRLSAVISIQSTGHPSAAIPSLPPRPWQRSLPLLAALPLLLALPLALLRADFFFFCVALVCYPQKPVCFIGRNHFRLIGSVGQCMCWKTIFIILF